MNKVFENDLPRIKSNAKSTEILEWKRHPRVKKWYKKIFEKSNDPENKTYITLIIENIWPSTVTQPPQHHIAWAISVVQILLDPKNSTVKITEDIVKRRLMDNIVSKYLFVFLKKI